MNVKELETRTGMARANIRYYESEGLIHPQRLPNGYRDYSEEDLVTLEKIKLLRELGIEINTIRLLQEGSLTLQQVLFGQLNRIEGEQVLLDRQRDVCKQLESLGLEYATLEPTPWLDRLAAPPEQQALPQETEPAAKEPEIYKIQLENYEPARLHPWRRYMARLIDFVLCDILLLSIPECLVNCISSAPIHFAIPGIIRTFLTNFIVLAIEPFLLSHWGWTPGKWLFGLKLRTDTGEKPSLDVLKERSMCIAQKGYGFFIPIYQLYRLWKSYQDIRDGVEPEWNRNWDCRYEVVPRQGGCAIGVAGYVLECVAVFFLTFFQPAVFWMVHAAHFPDLQTVETVYRNNENATDPVGTYVVYASGMTPEEEAKHATAVFQQNPDGSISATITKRFVNEKFSPSFHQEIDAVYALFGVEKPRHEAEEWWEAAFSALGEQDHLSVTFRGFRITKDIQSLNYTYTPWLGYEPATDQASFTRTVTITWTGDVLSWFFPLVF